jgi:hypothetical protein
MELGPEDAAKALVEALCVVGSHGRESGEVVKTAVADLDDDAKTNFDEGAGWVEEAL